MSNYQKAEITAICDIDTQKLELAQKLIESHQEQYRLEGLVKPAEFVSYDSLLASVSTGSLKIDLICLATPSGLHPSQASAAASLKIHVCTEKPMATRWDDGKSMVKACDQNGVRLFVVKQNRFNKTLQHLKKHIDSQRFGRIYMVAVNVFWQRPQSYYDSAKWRGSWEFDGGALMNQASHYVDLLDWLIGPVESLSASTATLGRSIEVEDTAALQLRWRNGALGTMSVTMLAYPKNYEASITILGEKGTVRIGGIAANKIEHWDFADYIQDDEIVNSLSYEPDSIYGDGHKQYYSNMFDVINNIAVPICDGREGLRSLELLIGAYRSARDGNVVHLPLEY